MCGSDKVVKENLKLRLKRMIDTEEDEEDIEEAPATKDLIEILGFDPDELDNETET
jgi:hypothetical protein